MPFKDKEDGKIARKAWLDKHPNYEHNRSLRRREENKEWLKQDRKANPDKYRNQDLKRNFNITLDEYDSLLEKQNFLCAICKTDKPGGRFNRFMVDHDHRCCPDKRGTCGKCIRGLLCHRCNIVLGEVKDSITTLQNMIEYLRGS